jgi:hypothetical protein
VAVRVTMGFAWLTALAMRGLPEQSDPAVAGITGACWTAGGGSCLVLVWTAHTQMFPGSRLVLSGYAGVLLRVVTAAACCRLGR